MGSLFLTMRSLPSSPLPDFRFFGFFFLVSSSGETTYESQDEIMEHVTDFYKQLYDHKETDENFDSLLF